MKVKKEEEEEEEEAGQNKQKLEEAKKEKEEEGGGQDQREQVTPATSQENGEGSSSPAPEKSASETSHPPSAPPLAPPRLPAYIKEMPGLVYFEATRDATGAIGRLAFYERTERGLLESLRSRGQQNAFARAFESAMPRSRRSLYSHSYQSYVWNKMASLRLNEMGREVVRGDLIFVKGAENSLMDPLLKDEDDEVMATDEKTGQSPEGAEGTAFTKGKHGGMGDGELLHKLQTSVRAVTQEEVDSKTFKLEDVVLPLPGYGIRLPDNQMAQHYQRFLLSEGTQCHLVHIPHTY